MKFEINDNGRDQTRPLIYRWEIFDASGVLIGCYIGKAKGGAGRPLKRYKRNVARLIAGKPYWPSKPDGYRRVHRALAAATIAGQRIVLSLLANVPEGENINLWERHQIREHDSSGPEPHQLND
jgi:hypothetical protein